jgi:sugar (pentulose or hexulose) kinase
MSPGVIHDAGGDMSFLGVDLGTSFIKGAVLNLEKRQLEHVRRAPFPEPVATGDPLHCEYDPNEIISVVRTLIDELAVHAPDCAGVVMCTQMHGLVLMNDRHQPVSNCVTWRDQRALAQHPPGAGSYFDSILARTNAAERRQLGNELQPSRPICFLFWFQENGKLSPGLTPTSIPDFVLSGLCDSNPGVDSTNASAYGAFNLETSDWHREAIRKLGLDHLCWPPLRKQGEVAGYLKLGPKSVPCYAPVGDAQTALCGSLLSTEELSLNIATGAQISRLRNELRLGDYQTRPYFDGKFLNTFSHPPAGRSLNVLLTLLTEMAAAQNVELADPWAYIADAVGKVSDTDLQVDLNLFPESGADGGSVVNIRADNLTVGHLFRAAFRNMADSYYECARKLWPEKSWKNLLFSGGLACKLESLREEVQRKFRSDCRLTPQTEDTLFGLLILALVFSGKATSVAEVSHQLRERPMKTGG